MQINHCTLMTQKTVLITGGAGYIGSHVNKVLQHAGYNTVVLDNLSRGNRLTIPNSHFIEGNINDQTLLDKIFTNHPIDAVMHFAAFIDVGESVLHPERYYQNNVANTLELLSSLVRHHINTFIFSSSASIFGIPQTSTLNENHPCSPINPYGESKWMVEKMLQNFDQAHGLKSCCLRYFNAAGGDPDGKIKHFQPHVTNLIPIILKRLKSGNNTISIFGTDYSTPDGTCIRDYIHIDDLSSAHILGMEQLWKTDQSFSYNLGNGRGYSVREVIRAVEKITGKHLNVIETDRRPGDPPLLVANAAKAHQELNWRPKYSSLETMIEHAWIAMDHR